MDAQKQGRVIVILVMAEEKWEEADFLCEQIDRLGHRAVLADIGLKMKPRGPCEITREEIISLSGVDFEEAMGITDRGKRMPLMVAGGIRKVRDLHSRGTLAGIVSLGGATGTQMATDIMRALPYGVPKLAVSSVANLLGFSNIFFGTGDVTMMSTVVEFTGLNNDLMRSALTRAAGSICGMAETATAVKVPSRGEGEKPLVAMTHWGLCENCIVRIRKDLEEHGYQVIGFSANGVADRAMEEMIERENMFEAVIDLAPGGVSEELFDFGRKAGPRRLEVAGEAGIPQVVATSGLNIGSPLSRNYRRNPELRDRKKYAYDSRRVFIRLTGEELILVARTVADKLNRAKGPVKVLVPMRGWSSIDQEGTAFYDGDLDRLLVDELKQRLRDDIDVREVDADLDTEVFGASVSMALFSCLAQIK